MALLVYPRQTGLQTFGAGPLQFFTPAASNAYKPVSSEPTRTTPLPRAADEKIPPKVMPVHSGLHVFGAVPKQPVWPRASKAHRRPAAPTYARPFASSGVEKIRSP